MSSPRSLTRPPCGAALAAIAVSLGAAGPAAAHVQVRPAVAAPADPVLFTVLVPNEKDAVTTTVTLKMPAGVIPFGFEATPGWTRTVARAPDQSVDTVTWRGRLPPEGFVRFSFLAGTPDRPGRVTWKALQRYADGTVVRWIGPPGSEEPAALTVIRSDAARENAGGEGSAAGSPVPPAATSTSGDSDGTAVVAWIALALGAGGLAAAAVALRRSRS